MSTSVSFFTILLLMNCFLGIVCEKPNQTYWHNWSDRDKVSHFSQCSFTNWTLVDFAPPSDPLWTDIKDGASKTIFIQLPVGWSGPWHTDPVPQFVIFLQGTGLWTTMDGTNRTFNTGDIYFGNDQASKKGHYSRNIGKVPIYQIAIQFASWPTTKYESCWLT